MTVGNLGMQEQRMIDRASRLLASQLAEHRHALRQGRTAAQQPHLMACCALRAVLRRRRDQRSISSPTTSAAAASAQAHRAHSPPPAAADNPGAGTEDASALGATAWRAKRAPCCCCGCMGPAAGAAACWLVACCCAETAEVESLPPALPRNRAAPSRNLASCSAPKVDKMCRIFIAYCCSAVAYCLMAATSAAWRSPTACAAEWTWAAAAVD
jgi:hypothetical protein